MIRAKIHCAVGIDMRHTTLTGTFEFREELIKERAFRYNPEDWIEFQ